MLRAVGSTSVWQWLAAITILERVCRQHWSRMGKYLPHMDTMAFSGDAVETGRVHTAVVANFTHGSVSHMVRAATALEVQRVATSFFFSTSSFVSSISTTVHD